MSAKIRQGNIRFRDMEKIVGNAFGEEYVLLKEELNTIGLSEQQGNTRITQLKQFRQLTQCTNGAKVVLQFSKEYKLTGNFREIEEIANVSCWLYIHVHLIMYKLK